MGEQREKELAGILGISHLKVEAPQTKPGAKGILTASIQSLLQGENAPAGPAAMGMLKGFPVAVSWTKREKQGTVSILVRFRAGSLKVAPEAAREEMISDPEILATMGQKKLSKAESKASVVADGYLRFHWDYSFRAPKPQKVSEVASRLVRLAGKWAQAVGEACDLCQSQRSSSLYSVDGALQMVCPTCFDRMNAEDQEKERTWDAVESTPVRGTLAGIAAAAVMALAWGGLAFATQKIYFYVAILIGAGIAVAIRWGIRKVTLYAKVLALALTVFAVLGGDFFFLVLSLAKELDRPASLELARLVLPKFFEIEFSESSGYLSVFLGLLGGVAAFALLKPKRVRREIVRLAEAA